jgi:hypothetical protein
VIGTRVSIIAPRVSGDSLVSELGRLEILHPEIAEIAETVIEFDGQDGVRAISRNRNRFLRDVV